MKISTEIDSVSMIVGEERAVEAVALAGFDAWDFSMFDMCRWNWAENKPYESDHPLKGKNYLEFSRRLRRIGLDNGIVCNQSHAPFPSGKPGMLDNLKRAIECTAEAGGEICVIHPDTYKTSEENLKRNVELYQGLLPFAKEYGVKIATENMWVWDKERDVAAVAACATPESFTALIDTVADDHLVACLDIGHAEMMGSITNATELIYALADRIKALHIHDNDRHRDSHQIPFSMNIDFTPIAKALADIGYDGYLTLECNRYLNGRTEENLFESLAELKNSIKKFDALIKNQ